MRRFAALFALALAACNSAQVEQCQSELLSKLKAPASFKRVKLDISNIPDSIHKPPYDSVTITYDAVNSYNAPLRDEYTCFFKPGTTDRIENPFMGEVDPAIDTNSTNATEAAAGAALNAAANAASNAQNAVAEAKSQVDQERHRVSAQCPQSC